jgi:hypothetical protein
VRLHQLLPLQLLLHRRDAWLGVQQLVLVGVLTRYWCPQGWRPGGCHSARCVPYCWYQQQWFCCRVLCHWGLREEQEGGRNVGAQYLREAEALQSWVWGVWMRVALLHPVDEVGGVVVLTVP